MLGVIGRNGAGQVDAPEDPHADRVADRGARRDPRPGRQPARGRDGLQPGAHGPRERLPERRDPRDEAPGDRAALRRHRRVLRGREVHRHAGQALLERHVRPARVRGRRASRARDPLRGRGARRRRRRVPAALPRAHGGARQHRADGALRLPHMPAVAQLCDRAIWIDGGRLVGDGPSERDHRATTSTRRPGRAPSGRGRRRRRRGTTSSRIRSVRVVDDDGMPRGRRRRPPAGRGRDRVHGARGGGPPVFPKIKVLRPGRPRSRSTRWTPTRAGTSRPRRATTSRPRGSPATCSTRASSASRPRSASIDSPEAPPPRRGATRPCRSTCSTRARATRPAAVHAASGAASSARSSSGRSVRANRVGASSSSSAPAYV